MDLGSRGIVLSTCICSENKGADQLLSYHTADLCLLFSHKLQHKLHVFKLLAHLSRRLIGELIVYGGIRRPSVVVVRRHEHFQTTSPLKPRGRFFSYFTSIASIGQGNE